MIKKITLALLFLIGLIYILWPEPSSINSFPALPNSLKSDEPGDTYQNIDISAYFSTFDRKYITEFYKKDFQKKFLFGIFPPLSLNYPPLESWNYVRDRQISTFLEEYVYPLRGSIFVNGYEAYVDIELQGLRHDPRGDHMEINGRFFTSKVTLRFYEAPIPAKVIVYLGIWLSAISLYKLYRKELLRS